MTAEDFRHHILTDDTFIEQQLEQFLIYYNLKHTLRWGFDNSQKDETESVAEHVFGMHILAEYFLPFYPDLDRERVRQLITWHDMAEAVVDDMTTRTKTDAHKQAETEAEQSLAATAALHIADTLRELFTEYEAQATPEAQFVKAVDKVEPVFHMYFVAKTTNISKEIFKTKDSGWTMKEYREHRRPYIAPFELIWRFDQVITPILDQAGFFRAVA